MTNPPLDFQQNPVEFVKDVLRVARAATKGPWKADRYDRHAYYVHTKTKTIATLDGVQSSASNHVKDAAYIAKFDPPTVIALMEDWLRLREATTGLRDSIYSHAVLCHEKNPGGQIMLLEALYALDDALAKQS